ncbi:hypothetical protein NLJ89_g11900 [Agrocybe chaxingu]|uniref:Uncharacterized protein n=1 Tax=Agrocybe chaxingu TaxID=84603 RepID=A0A9W8JP77_9AGAR|nr:hypothetical protein NLJ89_g11900 [Agrocybe chaxingu]
MASPSDPVRPPNKKRRLKTQMRPAGPGALKKKKKKGRVRFVGEEAEAEDKQTRIRSRNTDKTTSRE